MKNICFYFQLHLPLQLKRYRFFEIGRDHYYYDDFLTNERLNRLVYDSYLNANRTIAEMIKSSNGKFKCAFTISGIALELFEQHAPELIDSFREINKTGSVEFLAQPYGHSLSSVYNEAEFEMQVKMHSDKIESLFGKRPTTFFNTELIYSDEIGQLISKMGFKGVMIDEAKNILGWKSPNYVYNHCYIPKLKLLVRNNKLSDDMAFGFSSINLTAERFVSSINGFPKEEKTFNLGMGYDVFGIVQPGYTGIFEFLRALPYHVMEQQMTFVLPSEICKKTESSGPLTVSYPISWVGGDKDLTRWNGNDLQQEALSKLYAVSERVHLCGDKPLQHDWLMLQSADHFRYMSHNDAYGTPYETAYDAFMNYMNILADFLDRVDAQYPTTIENEELNELLKTINNQEKQIEVLETELKKTKTRKLK